MPREPKSTNANDYQVGGEHYRKKEGMQHWDYAEQKGFDKFQYVITKYVERWRDKNGIQDLEKAMHYLQKYIEVEKAKTHHANVYPEAKSFMPIQHPLSGLKIRNIQKEWSEKNTPNYTHGFDPKNEF